MPENFDAVSSPSPLSTRGSQHFLLNPASRSSPDEGFSPNRFLKKLEILIEMGPDLEILNRKQGRVKGNDELENGVVNREE